MYEKKQGILGVSLWLIYMNTQDMVKEIDWHIGGGFGKIAPKHASQPLRGFGCEGYRRPSKVFSSKHEPFLDLPLSQNSVAMISGVTSLKCGINPEDKFSLEFDLPNFIAISFIFLLPVLMLLLISN